MVPVAAVADTVTFSAEFENKAAKTDVEPEKVCLVVKVYALSKSLILDLAGRVGTQLFSTTTSCSLPSFPVVAGKLPVAARTA